MDAGAGVSYTLLVQQHIPSFLNPFSFFLNRASKLCMVSVDKCPLCRNYHSSCSTL